MVYSWGDEIVRGDPSDQDNYMKWSEVKLNIPGMENYDPCMPWVYKFNRDTGRLASDASAFVDDIRPTGPNEDACERTVHQIASRINYLGQQDAPRKRRAISQLGGMWNEAITGSNGKDVFVGTSMEKWTKAKNYIADLLNIFKVNKDRNISLPCFDYKDLEQKRGFLIHVGNTYTWMRPFFKGLNITLSAWRGGRDQDGWKLSAREWNETMREIEEGGGVDVESWLIGEGETPKIVVAATRLEEDLKALAQLMDFDIPPFRLVRGNKIAVVKYGFGDASGEGFGASWMSNKAGVRFRYGVWGRDANEGKSSNYRELKNLVDSVELMEDNNELYGVELFLFTDNSVAEAAFHRGTSNSRLLFELILKLKKIEIRNKMKLHFIHVSGKRMIAQGSDGLSRGNLFEGVMAGKSMLEYIPLAQSALSSSIYLRDWIDSWLLKDQNGIKIGTSKVLEPRDWFLRGHDIMGFEKNADGLKVPVIKSGFYIWAPPPAVADTAIAELRKARHKRTKSCHVVVIPSLMKYAWYRQLGKVADLMVEIPVGTCYWNNENFESLTLAIIFPFVSYRPWQMRRTPYLLDVERELRKVLKTRENAEGSILQQLCLSQRSMAGMSPNMVWSVLQGGFKV